MNADQHQVTDLVRELAAAVDMPTPPVRIRPKPRAAMVSRWRNREYGLTVGRALLTWPTRLQRGVLSHELSHVRYRDVWDPPTAVMTRLALLGGVSIFAAGGIVGVAVFLIATGLGLTAPGAASCTVLPLMLAAGAAGAAWNRGMNRYLRRCHVDPWRKELRADLFSVQCVGADDVRDTLGRIAGVEHRRGWPRTLRLTANAFSTRLAGTHPPTAWRLAAVDAYDPATDPDVAACEFLEARGHQAR